VSDRGEGPRKGRERDLAEFPRNSFGSKGNPARADSILHGPRCPPPAAPHGS
jgi:hypothetical protein